MRVSKHWFITLGCLTVFIVALITGVVWVDKYRYCDIRFRHNEICCSHEGINPFDVWAHRVESEGFVGLSRPDFPKVESAKARVHAYPPWHTTFAWFYKWIPQEALAALVTILTTLAFVLFGWTLRRWAPQVPREDKQAFFLIPFAGIAIPMAYLIGTANYGGILLALIIGMMSAFEKRQDTLLGLLWALAMIKPQVGLLLFWPLFFAKRYKAIAVAIGICSLATLWPAYIYHVSPLELILQVPQIGAPYVKADWTSVVGVVLNVLGPIGMPIWMGVCFLACAGLAFLSRRSNSVLLRFAPALIIFPFWTYSQPHDRVVLGLLYALILSAVFGTGSGLFGPRERTLFTGVTMGLLFAIVFTAIWSLATMFDLFDPSGIGWIYRFIDLLPTYLPGALATWLILKDTRRSPTA